MYFWVVYWPEPETVSRACEAKLGGGGGEGAADGCSAAAAAGLLALPPAAGEDTLTEEDEPVLFLPPATPAMIRMTMNAPRPMKTFRTMCRFFFGGCGGTP